MKKIVLLVFVAAMVLSVSGAWATVENLGTYTDTGTGIILAISRTSINDGLYIWQWNFTLTEPDVPGATVQDYFSAGLPVADTGGQALYTNFQGTGSLGQSITGSESVANTAVLWSALNLAIPGGSSATFSYETQLPDWVLANYQSRDSTWSTNYPLLPAPGMNMNPEPMSILLGCLGLTSIAGFERLRTK